MKNKRGISIAVVLMLLLQMTQGAYIAEEGNDLCEIESYEETETDSVAADEPAVPVTEETNDVPAPVEETEVPTDDEVGAETVSGPEEETTDTAEQIDPVTDAVTEVEAADSAASEGTAPVDAAPAAIDYTLRADVNITFIEGYAVIEEDTVDLYAEADIGSDVLAAVGEQVIYVIDRSEDLAMLETELLIDEEICHGWIAAAAVRPMSPEEVEAYLDTPAEPAMLDIEVTPGVSLKIGPYDVADGTWWPIGENEVVEMQVEMTGMGDDARLLVYSEEKCLEAAVAKDYGSITVKGIKESESTVMTILIVDGEGNYCVDPIRVGFVVFKQPTSISLQVAKHELYVGEQTSASVELSPGSSAYVTYSSSDESIAKVDSLGNITAVSRGKVYIIADTYSTTENVKRAYVPIAVYNRPASITLSETSYRVGLNGSITASYTAYDADGERSRGEVTFTSSNEDIFTVDAQTGVISGMSIGEAKLIAKIGDDISTQATVSVYDMRLKAEVVSLSVGETVNILDECGEWVNLNENDEMRVYYASTSSSIATVDKNGNVRGAKPGSANIRITTNSGLEKNIRVDVYKNPDGMKLKPEKTELAVDAYSDYEVIFRGGTFARYRLESSDESVAVIEDDMIHAVGVGEATITAVPLSDLIEPASCTIVVKNPATEIRFTQSEYTVRAGDTLKVSYSIPEGTTADARYESSDTDVFIVDTEGVIKASKDAAGKTAQLTVYTSVTDVMDTASVTVIEGPTEIAFAADVSELWIAAGDCIALPKVTVMDSQQNIVSSTITYSTTNPKVAQVDRDGYLTGVKAGTAYISATAYNGIRTQLKVNVSTYPITGVRIDETEIQYVIRPELGDYGDSVSLNGKALIGDFVTSGTVVYSSSDTAVAVVSDDGVITAVGRGSAVITASAFNGASAQCAVRVCTISNSVTFDINDLMGVSQVQQLYPIFEDEFSTSELTYASSDERVLKVTENGLIQAVGAGSALITVSGTNGISWSETVTVLAAPDKISLTGKKLFIRVGETIDLQPTFTPASGVYTGFTANGYDSDIVRVEDSSVTGLAVGSTDVTLQTCGQASVTCKIVVVTADVVTDAFTNDYICVVEGGIVDLASVISQGVECFRNGYSITCEDSAVKVSGTAVEALTPKKNVVITLTSNGKTLDTITLMIVSAEPIIRYKDEKDPAKIDLLTSDSDVIEKTKATLRITFLPDDAPAGCVLLGMPNVDVVSQNEVYASIDVSAAEDGYVCEVKTGTKNGSTNIVVTSGMYTKTVRINVNGVKYRALIIGEYNGSAEGALPFSPINTAGMDNLLRSKYAVTRVDSNPRKAVIGNLITTVFADTDEDDVSLVYIVAHGHIAGDGTYYFSIPTSNRASTRETVTSHELFNALNTIKGRVILFIDSCASGRFVSNQAANMRARGNFSVLTAQNDYVASWYYGKYGILEFFTSVLRRSMGDSAYADLLATLPANADTNGDGMYTMKEVVDYTVPSTVSIVNFCLSYNMSNGAFFIGVDNSKSGIQANLKAGWHQQPRYYIGAGMEDLIIK